MPRGGRRPGAGAPQGNKNALKHGRRVADRDLRAILARLPDAERLVVLRALREARETLPNNQTPPFDRTFAEAAQALIVRLPRAGASFQHQQQRSIKQQQQQPPKQSTQSNGCYPANRLQDPRFPVVLGRLISHHFLGAQHFLRHHMHAIDVVVRLLDHLDSMTDEEYQELETPGGWLREMVHQETFVYDDETGIVRCPSRACRWGQYRMDDRQQERGQA